MSREQQTNPEESALLLNVEVDETGVMNRMHPQAGDSKEVGLEPSSSESEEDEVLDWGQGRHELRPAIVEQLRQQIRQELYGLAGITPQYLAKHHLHLVAAHETRGQKSARYASYLLALTGAFIGFWVGEANGEEAKRSLQWVSEFTDLPAPPEALNQLSYLTSYTVNAIQGAVFSAKDLMIVPVLWPLIKEFRYLTIPIVFAALFCVPSADYSIILGDDAGVEPWILALSTTALVLLQAYGGAVTMRNFLRPYKVDWILDRLKSAAFETSFMSEAQMMRLYKGIIPLDRQTNKEIRLRDFREQLPLLSAELQRLPLDRQLAVMSNLFIYRPDLNVKAPTYRESFFNRIIRGLGGIIGLLGAVSFFALAFANEMVPDWLSPLVGIAWLFFFLLTGAEFFEQFLEFDKKKAWFSRLPMVLKIAHASLLLFNIIVNILPALTLAMLTSTEGELPYIGKISPWYSLVFVATSSYMANFVSVKALNHGLIELMKMIPGVPSDPHGEFYETLCHRLESANTRGNSIIMEEAKILKKRVDELSENRQVAEHHLTPQAPGLQVAGPVDFVATETTALTPTNGLGMFDHTRENYGTARGNAAASSSMQYYSV